MRSFYFLRTCLCFLFSVLVFSPSFSQTLSGTYTIPGMVAGTQVNNLTDLANLLDNPATVNGEVIFEFTSSYVGTAETFPIIFIKFNGTGNVVIRPAASVVSSLITSGATSGTTVVSFYGADNITFDGRPGGTGNAVDWQFVNANNTTILPTFDFVNGAQHDTLEYISIEASGSNTCGTITFDTSNVAGGNSNDVVQYCNIGNYNTYAYDHIYSAGSTQYPNSNNQIINNNIYNFQGYSTNFNGAIQITSTGNGNNWTISGNSFYGTSIIGFYGEPMSVIYFAPGSTSSGNVISNNYIGGRMPQCGGSRMSFRGGENDSWPDFQGIYVDAGGTTLVSDNTIQNIRIDSNAIDSQKFVGIAIGGGKANVFNNTIGSATDTNDIHNGTLGVILGIWDDSPDSVTIDSNIIANLTLDNAYPPGGWTYGQLAGIYAYNPNGIGPATIINNSVFNLNTANVDLVQEDYEINSGYGGGEGSLYYINGYWQNVLAGIFLQGTYNTNYLISENKIYNLEESQLGYNNTVFLYGIDAYGASGTNIAINGNKVSNIWAPDVYGSTNYYLGATGIYLTDDFPTGSFTLTNNMVDLGFTPGGGSVQNAWISGIWDNYGDNYATFKVHIYHNSVYIGGADSNRESNNLASYCFRRDVSGNNFDSLDIKNNIFFNARTTTSTSVDDKNYDIFLNSVTDVSSNYNELFAGSSTDEIGGIESAANYPTMISWKTGTGFDANSLNSNPQYLSDSVQPFNLHVQTTSPIDAKGTAAATIVYDIDSFVRANYTPVDIGAAVIDACGNNTITPSVSLSPSQNDVCKGTSITFTATPTNGGSAPTYNFYLDGVSVQNGASATYTNSSLNNNDSVRVVMTSDSTCLSTPTGTSADVVVVIKPNFTTNITSTICQGANYDGHTTTGTFIDTFTAANGCDSIRTLSLTVNAVKSITVVQTICQGANYDGHTVTGSYIDTFQAADGCDSIRTLDLTVNPVKKDTVTQTICQGANYYGHTATGTYIDTFPGANGCDSIRTLDLTVNPAKTDTIAQTICQGSSYAGHTTTGTYVDTYTATDGCDSIRTLNLTVNPVIRTTITQTVCQGQSYLGFTSTGTYTDTFTAANSCDSIRTLDLTVNPVVTSTVTTSICQGKSYDGHTTSGTYVDTLPAVDGCDSIRTLHLTVQSTIRDTVDQSICSGSNSDGHSIPGTYVDTFTSTGGCDSIRTLNLTVLPVGTSIISQTICQGQSYDGHSTGGTFTDTLPAANGCDSIVTLTLTVLPVSTTNITTSICQGQSVDGHTIGGTYVDTLKAYNGCDSIRTLHLSVLPVSSSSASQTICQGQTYQGHSTTGVYTDTLQSVNGCDSIVSLNLTVQAIIMDTFVKSICAGDNYDKHSQTGTYLDTFQSVAGCDSIRTLFLTVNPVVDTSLVKTICQGERYGGHTTSGIYTDTLQSQFGCDSIRTVILTVNPVSTTTITQYICQGQSYNGHVNSGDYVDTLGAYNGCDSIIYLTLYVQSQIKTISNDSICAGSNYFGYTQSGSYKDTFTAVGGCDSIRTLNLLVYPLITHTVTTAICSGTNYDGHDTAGTYIDTLHAANGCDSIRTLYLSILPIATGINKVQICEGDSFEGHHNSGIFEDTLTAANGCDSIVTVEITVNPLPPTPLITNNGNTLTATTATRYQWYQGNHILTGDTSQELTITQDGYYSVVITDSTNCSSTSAIDSVLKLGITGINGERFWKIFPNPTSGEVNIELNGIEQNTQIALKIFDATGKLAMEQAWLPSGNDYSKQVNLDNFAEGLYLIQVSQGDWSVSQRIVISK